MDIEYEEIKNIKDSSVSGLFVCIYTNFKLGISVMAIRGTEPDNYGDLYDDIKFMTYTGGQLQQSKDALSFYNSIKKSKTYEKEPINFICGHSLGGIIAKVIGPRTDCHVCAFNSPGVLDYLYDKKLPIEIKNNQIIKTYVANMDVVGEFMGWAELGEREYLATTEKNKERHNYNEKDPEIFEKKSPYYAVLSIVWKTKNEAFSFHGMGDLFIYMHRNNFENVFLVKKLDYSEKIRIYKKEKYEKSIKDCNNNQKCLEKYKFNNS